MPFSCFKKEKSDKNKSKGKKGASKADEGQNVPTIEEKPEASAKGAMSEDSLSLQPGQEVIPSKTPRSPRKGKTPRTPKHDDSTNAGGITNRDGLISSESSVVQPNNGTEEAAAAVEEPKDLLSATTTATTTTPVSPRKTKSPVMSPRSADGSIQPRASKSKHQSSPKPSSSPLISATELHLEGVSNNRPGGLLAPASARLDRSYGTLGSGSFSPTFLSARNRTSTFTRSSIASRGRTGSITMQEWSKIQQETESAVAGQRQRICERKATLAADMQVTLNALKKQEEEMNRHSTELDLDALDDLELSDDEVALAKFKEEDFNEDALEEKLLEQNIVAHLEQDVLKTKKAIDAMQDTDGSLDLDDLDNLDNLDDLELDVAQMEIFEQNDPTSEDDDDDDDDDEVPFSSRSNQNQQEETEKQLSSHHNTYDDPSFTEETHTDRTPRQGSENDLSTSAHATPRHRIQHSSSGESLSAQVDTVA
jgi:hypothetical protein